MRMFMVSLLGMLAAVEARAQSVSECSLITDPTLQRTCVENFKQQGHARGLNSPVLDNGITRGAVPTSRGVNPAPSRKGAKSRGKGVLPRPPPGDAPDQMP